MWIANYLQTPSRHLHGPFGIPGHSSLTQFSPSSFFHLSGDRELENLVGVGERVRKLEISDSIHSSFVTWQQVPLLF